MTDRIEKLKEFLESSPGDSFLHHAMALEYVKAGDDNEAGRIFEQILQKDPGYVGSYYHFARVLERQGNRAAAIKTYERGMLEAKAAGDQHAYNELQAAYEDLIY
ncbi:MAG: tetratricopeptide repeat protein [Chitinophagaceae bacterium]|nr:tetratricopeptide repeat protein [Chitinophagaceae bacterium]